MTGASPTGGGHVRAADLHAFTVIVCRGAACAPRPDLPVLDTLRAVVARSRHGVLVSTDCPLGRECPGLAGRSAFGAGATLLVQPCRPSDRAPSGAAVRFGPVRTLAELQDACAWIALHSGQGDPPARLPRRGGRPSALN